MKFFSLALLSASLGVNALENEDDNTPKRDCDPEKFCCDKGDFCETAVDSLTNLGRQDPTVRAGTGSVTRTKVSGSIVQALSEQQTPNPRFGLQFKINLVSNYGCWCYEWSQWQTGEGRSTPRDAHDDACKAHSMGFKCITLDAKAEGKECHPYETSYETLITQNKYGQKIVECADSIEDDWCKRRVCLVELRLLARFYTLIGQGVWPDYMNYGHASANRGLFDPLNECNPLGGKSPVEQVCCGDYPYRSWFYANEKNSQGTQCCEYVDKQITKDYGFTINVGALYNSKTEKCISSGVVDL